MKYNNLPQEDKDEIRSRMLRRAERWCNMKETRHPTMDTYDVAFTSGFRAGLAYRDLPFEKIEPIVKAISMATSGETDNKWANRAWKLIREGVQGMTVETAIASTKVYEPIPESPADPDEEEE